MAEPLIKLAEALSKEDTNLSPSFSVDLTHRAGLEILFKILDFASDLAPQSWNDAQIQQLSCLASAIACSSRSSSVEQVDTVVLAVVQKSVEVGLSCLERASFDGDDFSIQNNMLQILESALVDGAIKVPEAAQSCSVSSLTEILPLIADISGSIEFDDHIKSSLQERASCLRDDKVANQIFLTLASECVPVNEQATGLSEPVLPQDLRKLVFLSQYWAVTQVGCLPRLIMVCRGLIVLPDMFDEKVAGPNFRKRFTFCSRILKLLRNVTNYIPYIEYDVSLVQAIASFANTLPCLFRTRIEFGSGNAAVEGSFESLVLLLVEEFLDLARAVFYNSHVFLNIQAGLTASILDSLDSSAWRYDKSSSNVKPPLACFPRSVIFLLKLIHNVTRQANRAVGWKQFDTEGLGGSVDLQNDLSSCCIHFEKVNLLKIYTFQQLLEIMFPTSNQWLDNLMHLIFFLHSEGLKLKPKMERSLSVGAKTASNSAELDNAVCHEDEALFGDLFSESGRSIGSVDGNDQAPVAVNSSNRNMPIEAAVEVLSFLKGCIFSTEGYPSLFVDGRVNLSSNHIDIFHSLLLSHEYCADDKASDNCFPHEENNINRVREIIFELLQDLLARLALADSLEEYLVEKILSIENDMFVYTDQTLTLLAHTLFCRVGEAGSKVRAHICKKYASFIVEKTKAICLKCPSLKDLLGGLPSLLHIEILLMAFHLSSEAEKAVLAKLMFSSLRELEAPGSGFDSTQLSCWALLISRLILVLRHMILYPHSCPSSLLLHLRSKLRESPRVSSNLTDCVDDRLSSWALVTVKKVIRTCSEEGSIIGSLINQLFDISDDSTTVSREDLGSGCLSLSSDDIFSTISWILGFWKGISATAVEDFIVERYVFLLCWDFSAMATSKEALSLWREPQTLDSSNMTHFFFFSHSILNGLHRSDNFVEVVVHALQHLNAKPFPQNVEELGWDFLRNGMWLSSVLSLLNVGIERHAGMKSDQGVDSNTVNQISGENEYGAFAESLVSTIVEGGQSEMLVTLLSSLLNRYLCIYQKAFLAAFNNSEKGIGGFSQCLLLKHSGVEKGSLDELEKICNASQLESVFELLPKLDSLLDKRAAGFSSGSLKFLLHGFPFDLQVYTGIILSCVLGIRGIIFVLDGLLRLEDSRGNACRGIDVLRQILDSVMEVKFDRIFRSIHDKCDAIYQTLIGGLGGSDYSDLFLLGHMEGFLRDINVRGVLNSSVHECIVTKMIDTINSLRKDPSKSGIFKFYLGVEDDSEKLQALFELHRGDLLVLIDTLDTCYSEAVNVKVLNFFLDLLAGEVCPGLKQKLQDKFLSMDLLCLSKWLEKRLLGCITEESAEIGGGKGCSVPLRESTLNFVLCLVESPSDLKLNELQSHIFEAVLGSLDLAFMSFDIHVSKYFLHFIVQLAKGESSMKSLLEKSVMLMEKLAGDERLLPGLKFLFGFLGTVLSDSGSGMSIKERSHGNSLTSNAVGVSPITSRPLGSRKDPETLVLSANDEGGSSTLECDGTSIDEDEDDGTSDGEVASIDKDDEEDTNNEKTLASKVCTFTSSGSNFMEQHWYFCYTCDLTVSKGCCSVCAKVCHRGHRVVYSRSSRFFCDCGAGGVRGSNCQCLKPRKFTGSSIPPVRTASNFQAFLPFPEDGDQLPESDSDLDEETFPEMDNQTRLYIQRELQDGIPSFLGGIDFEGRVLQLCSSLLPTVTSLRDSNLSKDNKISLGKDKVLSFGVDLLQLKKAYKSGSLDLKIKADYPNAKELKSHLATGSLVKSLLSVSTRGRLAVGEGDKVAIFDVGQLIGQATIAPVTADKTNVKPLSKNVVRFEIVHLTFNPAVENYLAVAGFEDCQVLTVNPRGEVTDRLAIELELHGAFIRQVSWVPGSQVQLMVVTNKAVKIYDLSQDNISPVHCFTLPDDMIIDATLLVAQRKIFLVVLSERGSLFRLELSVEGSVGAKPLTDVVEIPGRDIHAKGTSLYFSSTYKLMFVSYQDGTTLVGRLSPNATSLTETSTVHEEEQDSKLRPAGLHRWRELLPGSGLFVCFSSLRSNSVLAVSMGADEIHAQNMRHAVGSTSTLVGVTAYKPLSKDKIHCLILHDDGSLQIYSHVPVGVDAAANLTAEKVKKLGSGILTNKAYAGLAPEFPLDFFEKTVCITADVKLGGDAIRNGESDGAKQSLASEDGYLESPNPSGFKISVFNSNPDVVMVGFRVHAGNTSTNHIPSEISIFQRVIKLDEGMRSWYDIPFTVAESLLADEEFTITVGPTFNGSALPRIDSLEVYGRAKDEFGWKEKMDAVLDMEARVLSCNSLLSGSSRKRRSMQSAPVQEQVIADGLTLLSKLYTLCGSQGGTKAEEVHLELSKLNCRQLLEKIFESDREPLLQAAACRVLQAVFPKKDIYYHVKDSMRLLGVVKSTSTLSSRLGAGGIAGACLIEEFTAQMRAVSKIALHRRSNLATFLELNGSEVVDGLMQVLWGILEFEQPDTQTMNNIVVSSVELIYCYAECLALHGKDSGAHSVAPAVVLFKKLLFSSNEAVQTSSSLAISSRLLQVPFPKQTMLATEDAIENAISARRPTEATGGNVQVMTEEDNINSSVQYCCDGCSTVPILRRRWHCTICPDFDLCEACYEVLDADRLPPPHSRDHPMTAIPIEVESLGGDGNEFHFTPDDTGDQNIMPSLVSVDSGIQNSAPSIHVLETNESGEFSSSVSDTVSISASKRAVNSLLLSELLEQLKGWMKATSGVRAIPIMQLFYRLSSAVGGPFINISKPESLDLEKLIKWFLAELNLSQPFDAKARTPFGEVAILVFMFFTLMLRNWHQPGSGDSSTTKPSDALDKSITRGGAAVSPSSDDQEKNDFASQLLRACNSLRQQPFANYLLDNLQQLMHVFKSSAGGNESGSPGSGCGALLTVRRDLPAGNFSPFFSDSYAKAHRSDIFSDYHRLLLENTFRLIYTLIRPEKQDKGGEKDKGSKISPGKDLKLDAYQDVLCCYINNPHTNFVRRYARRLFLHLCGSKTHYYSVRDSWQYSSEMKRLLKYVNKYGGFHNPVPYERSVKIVKSLCTMAEVAAARPRNWQKYCLRHGDVLPFLMKGVFYLGEESVFQTLKLLNLAFFTGKEINSNVSQKSNSADDGLGTNKQSSQSLDPKKKKKGEEGTETSSEKSCLDMESVVDVFTGRGGEVLMEFIDYFLLEWNSSSVRSEAKSALHGVWHHAKPSLREIMLAGLLQKVKSLPMYGQNIVEYTELVTWLLGKVPDVSLKQQNAEIIDRCLTSDVIRSIFETLHSQNELLANHPNSRIYNTLSGLVEFDGYYLESEPCVACSSPEVPYSRMKLESLKSETKFTDNRIIVKCTGSYTIQTVTMNVHDARKSKSVKVLNLYYNNRPVADLSEVKNNWSLWKRAKTCHLAFNQTELKVEFPIPITACNFMIELDSFYENLQALSLEPLQCPRCSRPVTDKHGICSNCHENAYQCRQCRNINYENLDSFLCNECGYSKYGRFEFNFMAKPSFTFDNMENEEDMKKGLAAIESESENAHRRYQQLLGFKKPLLKIVSSIGENEIDSQQKDSVQQMMVSLPGPSCKVNRKIALLGVLYGEKCKAAFDSVSKSVQTLQGLRRVLMSYLHQKNTDGGVASSRFVVSRSPNNCFGCASTFVTQCLEILQVLSKHPNSKKQLVSAGILSELFENNIHQGPKTARIQARSVLCAFSEGDINAISELNNLIQRKVMYCLEHHRSMDIALVTREELSLLSEVCALTDEFWESRLRVVFQLLFSSIKLGAKHPAIAEHVILPCLRIISQACTPPKPDGADKDSSMAKSGSGLQIKAENDSNLSGSAGLVSGSKSTPELEKNWDASKKTQDIQLLSYSEWEKGASYIDFVRRQYKVSQGVKSGVQRSRQQRQDFLALKCAFKWKRQASKSSKGDLSVFELGSWVTELVLSACSQSIRSEMCMLISLLCAQSASRRFRLLNLLVSLLPATLSSGESAAEYFELLFKMIESEDARLFLTVRGCLRTICKLITQEVETVESLERSLRIDISQGFILHKLIELLGKFLEVPNIRSRFMKDNLLSEILEALIVIRGLIVQKTKLISDCNRLLKDLLDSLLLENSENKRQFIRACICGLQIHGEERKGRNSLFILEQLCNLICPSKPEPVYLLVLNKAHTQEEFIRGSMTKNPYSSAEIGPLLRDVKNKICHQLDLLGLVEDDYGMELLVAGNIISLDLSVAQVYEQVWKKSNQSSSVLANTNLLSSSSNAASGRECPPMNVTYRLQGLDGEATEPMIKELEEDREESQDPEVEFAIAGAVQEYGGLEIILGIIQRLRDDFKSNQEQLAAVLNLLMYCCKIRENRRALLRLGGLGLLLETARRAFSVDAMDPAEGILLIVESLTLEANESENISINQSTLTESSNETDEQAKKIVLMFLDRLSHPTGLKKSNKQQRNTEMVARILPYLTYGEPAAMEALIQHFSPYLHDWAKFDELQKQHEDNPEDESIAKQAVKQRFTLENFVRVSESLKTSSCGERLKDIILERGITGVAVGHLRDNFAVSRDTGFKSSKTSVEWGSGLKLASVPLILSMLRGLSTGHLPTQRCIDEGSILPLLHALEGVAGENEIGARAENLLDTLSNKEGKGDGFLEDKVRSLRHATRDEMRRLALRKREEMLQGLGMRQELASDGGERIVVSRPIIEGFEDVEEEEDGLACMVCREGYSLRPTDLLGVYSYSKRVNLGSGSLGSARGDCVYTTVSYFNIIHFQCHQEAKRADANLKHPKKEWEGATLRNNESLCNSLFPIRGPSVPLPQYLRYLDQYWDNLGALGRADGTRLRLLTYDIVLMLARFATGASFSAESRGGGTESNSKFLPFMIQMARHLLDQGSPSQRQAMSKSVSTYISSSSSTTTTSSSSTESSPRPSTPSSGGTQSEETVQFMMVNSLLSESYESWLQHRRVFLQRGIYHAYMQHTHGQPSSSSSRSSSSSETKISENDLLPIIRPMLVYTGLIEQMQRFFKVKKPPIAAAAAVPAEDEVWVSVMKERLLSVKEMIGFSKEVLSWLEEMSSAEDLQEAFDVVGALSDVLSGGVTRCEDFVNAAISAGKS